ncbi:MAG: lipid II flippase MurJ [Candidatus Micrarchaeia archaeon]
MIGILNLLTFLRIFLSLFFQILLVRNFGAAIETDVYYLAIGVVTFFNGILLGFITDFYIPIYNEVKAKEGKRESGRFAGATFLGTLLLEFLILLFLWFSAPYLAKIFASGFTEEKIVFSSKVIRIVSISTLFMGINTILTYTLQANFFMFVTYLTSCFLPIFNITTLLIFSDRFGIEAIAFSIVAGYAFNFFILLVYAQKISMDLNNPFRNPWYLSLMKHNLPTRAGGFLYSLKDPITINVLSHFPTGYLTLYTYAQRIISILFEITNSPIFNFFYMKASNLVSSEKFTELKQRLSSTIGNNTTLFILVLIPFMVFFEDLFSPLFGTRVSDKQLLIIYRLFLFLIPFYLVLSFEIPFTHITYALKGGLKVFQIASVFILLYSALLVSGIKFFQIYILPLSLFLAQLSNAVTYALYVNKKLHIIDFDLLKKVLKFSIFVFLLIFVNLLFKRNAVYTAGISGIILFLWVLIDKKEISSSFKFILRKGEVR